VLASACAGVPGLEVISSLAGRTRAPTLPVGEVRIGGFGGVAGLVGYLRAEAIEAVVDATHPFAATITANAAAASSLTGVPLLVLRRPGWAERPGDAWHRVASLDAAAAALLPGAFEDGGGLRGPALGERVLLTTGRQGIAAFAGVDACWFLSRSVEAPVPPVPRRLEVLLDRGPFTVEGERALLARHRIDVLVTKDSGGSAAKLDAAREAGIPVVVVDRPPLPRSVTLATTVAAAADWLSRGSAGACTSG
jgi:precorrin-6A/cobalt-precorrin-6A reductase